ncbi:DUF1566 domain-containing protein [Deltaproteobacteria bacterium TL4]
MKQLSLLLFATLFLSSCAFQPQEGDTLDWDDQPPTTVSLTIKEGDVVTSPNITLVVQAQDNEKLGAYHVSEQAGKPAVDSPLWQELPRQKEVEDLELPYTLAQAGTHTLYLWVADYDTNVTGRTASTCFLAAPQVTATVSGIDQITLTWNSNDCASGYNLYWSNTAGVTTSNGTKISNVTSPYTHSVLTNAAYYILTAVNAGGESSASNDVSVTVTVSLGSLMWQREDDGITRNWQDAINYCEALTLAGYNDWRLPTRDELKTLIKAGSPPTIDTTLFPNTKE